MSYCGKFLLSFALYITLPLGTKSSTVCPESKKLYPGDCRLFYKCVALYDSTSTPASVWIPTRCTAGMVFHPTQKKCVPNYSVNCHNMGSYAIELNQHQIDYKNPHTHNAGVILNALEQDRVPLSVVNNPPMDSIDKQMIHLKKLINNFHNTNTGTFLETGMPMKETFYSDYNKENPQPLKENLFMKGPNEKDPLPIQLSEITEQLILSTAPLQTNINVYQSNELKHDPLNFTTYPFTSYVPGNLKPIIKSSINKFKVIPSQVKPTDIHRPNINLSIINKNKHEPMSNFNSELYDDDTFKLAEDIEKFYSYDKVNQFNNNEYNDKDRSNCIIGTRFPNLDDCRKYHICGASGRNNFYEFTCPSNMAFNKLKKVCDVKVYKQCIRGNIKRG